MDRSQPPTRWHPTNPGILKLNVDAAINAEADYIGVGAIIRDNAGMVVGAFTTRFRGHFSAFIAECISVREGLKFAMEEGVMVNMIETDCLNVISAIHSRSSLGIESSIIEDIVVILSWLDNVSCSDIPRSGNEAAHSLARFALFASCITMVWKNEIPECIFVLNDLPT